MYVYSVFGAFAPLGVVTNTLTAPAACAGAVQLISVSETKLTEVQAAPPKVTPVTPVNPVPVIVTLFPPVVGPDVGFTLVTVGGPVTVMLAIDVSATRFPLSSAKKPVVFRNDAVVEKIPLLAKVGFTVATPEAFVVPERFAGVPPKSNVTDSPGIGDPPGTVVKVALTGHGVPVVQLAGASVSVDRLTPRACLKWTNSASSSRHSSH